MFRTSLCLMLVFMGCNSPKVPIETKVDKTVSQENKIEIEWAKNDYHDNWKQVFVYRIIEIEGKKILIMRTASQRYGGNLAIMEWKDDVEQQVDPESP